MKITICLLMGLILVAMMQPATSQEESKATVALLVDVDMPPSPSQDQEYSAEDNLHKMYAEIKNRDMTATLLLNQDVLASRIRLLLAQYTVLSNFEFAISGKHTNDQLSSMSLSEQEELIERSIELGKAARVCGMSEVEVLGFMPSSFDQNQDTYKVLDNLGIQYDAGFQAGLIYEPGHKDDLWPYQVEGHQFYALPISTVEFSGELVPLYDRQMNQSGVSSTDWQDTLKSKLEKSIADGEPMVVLLSTSTSGTGDYFDALKSFLNYARSREVTFVNARDLISLATNDSLTLTDRRPTECPGCSEEEGIGVSISRVMPEPTNLTEEGELNETMEKEAVI